MLTVGNTETINLSLKVASVNEQVVISSDVASVDAEESATGTTIGRRAISDLPIRGRNFTDFIQLTPGIVQESDRKGLVIAGQCSINSNIALDGADFNDALQGNQRGGNDAVFFFPQTAIREFQVVRSGASAKVGRTGAGLVEINTRVRPDTAVQRAFGRNGCAEQSIINDTLNACTAENVQQLRQAVNAVLRAHGRSFRHDFQQAVLLLNSDVTGLPAGRIGDRSAVDLPEIAVQIYGRIIAETRRSD